MTGLYICTDYGLTITTAIFNSSRGACPRCSGKCHILNRFGVMRGKSGRNICKRYWCSNPCPLRDWPLCKRCTLSLAHIAENARLSIAGESSNRTLTQKLSAFFKPNEIISTSQQLSNIREFVKRWENIFGSVEGRERNSIKPAIGERRSVYVPRVSSDILNSNPTLDENRFGAKSVLITSPDYRELNFLAQHFGYSFSWALTKTDAWKGASWISQRLGILYPQRRNADIKGFVFQTGPVTQNRQCSLYLTDLAIGDLLSAVRKVGSSS